MSTNYKFITQCGKVKDLNSIYLNGDTRESIVFAGEHNIISNFLTRKETIEIVIDSLLLACGDYQKEMHLLAFNWLLELTDEDDFKIALVSEHSDFFYALEEGMFEFLDEDHIQITRDKEENPYEYDFIFDYENGVTVKDFDLKSLREEKNKPVERTEENKNMFFEFNLQDFLKYWTGIKNNENK